MYKLDLEKAEESNQRANCQHLLDHRKKQENSRKTSTSSSLITLKTLCDHNKLWEILKEMGISEHPTCLLQNLYAGQEATVRTRHVTKDWFKTGKGVHQGCILSPCLFNLYAGQTCVSWAPKSLRMVTAAMKLKGACSLEEKL